MEASPSDLAKFGDAVLANKLFPQSVRDQMWTGSSVRPSYGAGWDLGSSTRRKSGGQQGASSHLRISLPDKITVAVMTNVEQLEGSTASGLAKELMDIAKANP